MNSTISVLIGILMPFAGTTVGAAFAIFFRGSVRARSTAALSGFSAGVMIAASVWSLIIPSIEMAQDMGRLPAFIPAVVGISLGAYGMLLIDALDARRRGKDEVRTLVFAVTLHNIPEGMAVGVALAAAKAGTAGDFAAALLLSLGIAVQNLPEGAIVSLPLACAGMSRRRAFLCGTLSGVVEPIGALLALAFVLWISPALPFILAVAAGAMLYACVAELIPRAVADGGEWIGVGSFVGGFSLMMALDVLFA